MQLTITHNKMKNDPLPSTFSSTRAFAAKIRLKYGDLSLRGGGNYLRDWYDFMDKVDYSMLIVQLEAHATKKQRRIVNFVNITAFKSMF